MNRKLATTLIAVSLTLAGAAVAGPRDDLLARYAAEAKQPLSAARGATLHTTKFGLGKPDTPACTTCHADDPRSAGRTPAGKAIEPMAASLSPSRYTDAAKVEKWFRRNCTEVLGRECTPLEKGDWLSYMASR